MYTLVIDIAILLLLLINLIILFFLVVLIVKIQENQKMFIADIVEILQNFMPNESNINVSKIKSWDQKFEDDLNEIQRRIQNDRGLVDPEK